MSCQGPMKDDTYRIVRFYEDDRPAEVVRTGLTLDQAQNHCNSPATHGEGWFDGYTKDFEMREVGWDAPA